MGGVALVLTGAVVAGYVMLVVPDRREAARDASAAESAERVAAALAAGDLGPAGFADASADEEHAQVVEGLGEVEPQVTVTGVERDGSAATATLSTTWPFGAGWTYSSTVELVTPDDDPGPFDTSGGTWTPVFEPSVVHPDLVAGDSLATQRVRGARGDVLARDGRAVVTEQPVVDIGVQPARATDVDALTSALAHILQIDRADLADRVRAAGPNDFVAVLTLRRADYDAVRDRLQALPGTVFREATLPLAPTREFARPLLGRTGAATAELVDASDGRLVAGDQAGLSGLQREYDEHLSGAAGYTVDRVGDAERTSLFEVAPTDGADLVLSLDIDVQLAADAAVASATGGNGNAALVAIDMTSGDVVAVANAPESGTDRALLGQYPPGSTFKTVSTLALLGTGLTPAETVPCPPTATVQGRSFRNFEGGAAGVVPFATDFAQSCNTAFVALSQRLQPGDLGVAGASVGLGGDWTIGTEAFTGSVPDTESPVDLAAATIGQGRLLASPIAMAQVAATIGTGSWTAPRLVTAPVPAPGTSTPEPDAARLATVRDLMRLVATEGTASALADVPDEPVHAKTGTAEYGTEDPPGTHAWTIGFQGDLAFAVLVEDGASGGAVAVPVVESFLRSLPD